jgi:hypothetical protein
MSWHNSLRILREEKIADALNHDRSRTSSVTTSWGVDWNEEFIARDLWQNFFDANRHCLPNVKVLVAGHTVTISAPTPMELERLFYLGSDKGDDDVGKYGEGFKVATVCLLRNHNIEPIVVSGDRNRVVRRRQDLDPYERKWEAAQAAVASEREARSSTRGGKTIEDTLGSMTEDQLRDLLKRVPEMTIRRALSAESERPST